MNIQNRINTLRENFFSLKAFFVFIIIFAVYPGLFYAVVTKEMNVSNPDWWALLTTAFVGAISCIFIISLSDKDPFKSFDNFDYLDYIHFVFGGFNICVIVFFVTGIGLSVGVGAVVFGVFSVVGGVVGVVGSCVALALAMATATASYVALAMATATAYGTGLISLAIAITMAKYSVVFFVTLICLIALFTLLKKLISYSQ